MRGLSTVVLANSWETDSDSDGHNCGYRSVSLSGRSIHGLLVKLIVKS